MRLPFTIFLFCALSAHALFGQETRVSVGLNTSYVGSRQLGLGAAIDFQHRLSTHWELLGGLSTIRTLRVGRVDERSVLGYKSSTFGFLGVGIGYRSGTEERGFHAGLLPGILLNPTVKVGRPNDMALLPAMTVNIGHSIGKRGDLNVDLVTGRDKTGFPGYGGLRYSFLLFKKH